MNTIALIFFLSIIIYILLKAIRNYRKEIEKGTIIFSSEIIESTPKDLNKENIYQKKRDTWINEHINILLAKSSVIDLILTKDILSIGYSDLLDCYEWHYKRYRILKRDNFTCQDCSETGYHLHIHHKFYLKDYLPWEIEENALVALCRNCHKKRHDNETIYVYKKVGNQLIKTTNTNMYCTRCNGAGIFPEYMHVIDGKCFKCLGNCIDQTIFSHRLTEIKSDPSSYNINQIVDDSIAYLNNITVEYFQKEIYPIEKLISFSNLDDKKITPEKSNDYDDLPF